MRRTLLGLGILVVSAVPACGPSQPAPATPTTPPHADTAAPPPGAAVAKGPAFDLAPVAEPPELVGVARWKSPGATFATASATAGLPKALVDSSSKMAVEEILKEALRGIADPRQLAEVVSMDASVDAVAILDPSPRKRDLLGAISIGLTSLERAREAAESTGGATEVSPGVWKIGARERFGASCVIAASAGPTPARLVCGSREKDVTALAPYLVRNVATQPAPASDLHGELRFGPVQERFGKQLRDLFAQVPLLAQTAISLNDERFDRTVREASKAVADDLGLLVGDLDKITLDLGLSPAGVAATGALQVRNRKSWLLQTLAERPERAGPPPAIFWRAPKDSDSVFYARGTDPGRWSPVLTATRTLLDSALSKEKVGSKADRDALAALIALPLGKDTNSVTASGHFAPAKLGEKATPQQKLDALTGGWIGWHLLGVDEGPAALTKYVKDLVAVYNRGALLAPIKKELRADAKLLPTVKTVPAPRELGAGALAVEIKVTDIPADAMPDFDRGGRGGPPPKAKLTFTAHLLLMGDGNTTWLALGTDRAELVKRLLAVKSGAPETATLRTRTGLDALKSGTTMSGGFFSLSAITSNIPGLLEPMAAAEPDMQELMRALMTLPNKGETPILMSSKVTGGAGAGANEVSLNLPKGVLEDVAAFAMSVAKVAQRKSSVAGP